MVPLEKREKLARSDPKAHLDHREQMEKWERKERRVKRARKGRLACRAKRDQLEMMVYLEKTEFLVKTD